MLHLKPSLAINADRSQNTIVKSKLAALVDYCNGRSSLPAAVATEWSVVTTRPATTSSTTAAASTAVATTASTATAVTRHLRKTRVDLLLGLGENLDEVTGLLGVCEGC